MKPVNKSARITSRRRLARESFGLAAECLGKCGPGMSLFAITRGQWSMIDAILHVLDEVGPASLSVWTWTVAEYEVEVLTRLRDDRRLTGGRLIIDAGARLKNHQIISGWQAAYGPDSVRYVVNHAKLARIETASGLRFLLRGSMNLNFNPRFEQFDITEGGPEFDLIKGIEDELPILPDSCSNGDAYAASKLDNAFTSKTLEMFSGVKVWAK